MARKGTHRISNEIWSPRQVIGSVLSLCLLMILVPIGARAAGSLMTIVDSTSTNQARVQSGALRVNELPVNASRWWNFVGLGAGGGGVLYTPTNKKNLFLSSVMATNHSSSWQSIEIKFLAPCDASGDIVEIEDIYVPAHQTASVAYPEALPIVRSNTNWCLNAQTQGPNNDGGTYVQAVGYVT